MKKIDWRFVERLEARRLTGYVPKRKNGEYFQKSGVTVGTGIDLGQRDRAEIVATFIPDTLKRKLIPYAGLKGIRAAEALRVRPLVLSNEEVTLLDCAIQRQILRQLEIRYDRDSATHFDMLPGPAQTVLMSLAWNFGPALDRWLPTTWKFAIDQNWYEMADFIQKMPMKQPELAKRRKKEAELLRQVRPPQ